MEQSALTTTATATTNTMSLSKRQHALHELLASERAYASDLALVSEVYIPLAIGQSVMVYLPMQPDSSSAASSRIPSSFTMTEPPMTPEDAEIIFKNISELAHLSDSFCEMLEQALGSVLPGGVGGDRVGELFLRMIPELEAPYKTYIIQFTAHQYLQSLPKSPSLEAYFTQTQLYSSHISHAWDLHSLLIKPVQRLLIYPLLLRTIIAETPDDHPDRPNLRKAKDMVEAVARNVNEERRRAEVVKGILTGDGKKKFTPASIGVAASVNIGKMKSLRRRKEKERDGTIGGLVASPGMPYSILGAGSDTSGTSSEAQKVAQLTTELKQIELFAQQLAEHIIDYVRSMQFLTSHLITWSSSFARVIGLNDEQGSEAFDAFLAVPEDDLLPLSRKLEATVKETLLRDVARLISTIRKPMKLVESMEEQEPYHYRLLNTFSAKSRPPPTLLEASSNYLALRGQLASELPVYIGLLHKGLTLSLRKLTEIQQTYWAGVRDAWGELWDMLRAEGEVNTGAEETVEVWSARWGDVDEGVRGLGITSAWYLNPFGRPKSLKRGTQVKISMTAPIAEQSIHQDAKEARDLKSYLDGPVPYPSRLRSPVPQDHMQPASRERPLHATPQIPQQSFEVSSTVMRSPSQSSESDGESSMKHTQGMNEKEKQSMKTSTSVVVVVNMSSALESAHSPTKSLPSENRTRRSYASSMMASSISSSSSYASSMHTALSRRESSESVALSVSVDLPMNKGPQADDMRHVEAAVGPEGERLLGRAGEEEV